MVSLKHWDPGSNPRQAWILQEQLEGCGVHPPNNEGLFFTTKNRVTTLAPQGKESDREQGELTLSGMVALGGWGGHRGRGKGPQDTPGRPLLSRDREMASGLAGLTCRQTATPPVHCP